MGNSPFSPANLARLSALGVKYMTHAQALVDCTPSSQLSDAQKQWCLKNLEENPVVAGQIIEKVMERKRNAFDPECFKAMMDTGWFPLREPNKPHHYRGYAERIPPDTPPVVAPEAAAASAAASASVHSSIVEDPPHPTVASSEASSSSCAVSSAPVADDEDECAADEERISLLAKKTQ